MFVFPAIKDHLSRKTINAEPHWVLVTPYGIHWRCWSTLAQAMTAPCHCLNQCWLIIKGVKRHSPGRNFTRSAHELNPYQEFRNYIFESLPHVPSKGQQVNWNDRWHKKPTTYSKIYYIISCGILQGHCQVKFNHKGQWISLWQTMHTGCTSCYRWQAKAYSEELISGCRKKGRTNVSYIDSCCASFRYIYIYCDL